MFFGVVSVPEFGMMHGPGPYMGFMLLASIIWTLIILIGLIWQAYDAYSLAKYYNNYIQTYQRTKYNMNKI